MLSKAVIKFINSLQIKKYRLLHQTFVVEGAKSVQELLASDLEIDKLFVTREFLLQHEKLLSKRCEFEVVSETQLVQAGSYTSNNAALALVKMKQLPALIVEPTKLLLALDDVRDPGNLGTIIRIADWYGLKRIVCSETCADFYNPKVIASTMGSFTRVAAHYVDLPEFLHEQAGKMEIFGASMEGVNIHKMDLQPKGILVMGNEANGIRPDVGKHVSRIIKIPGFGQAESLNVATATAIIVDNFFRNFTP